MSKLSRKEFKVLLTEWNNNFINENLNEKEKLREFFDFVKSKLPYIITTCDAKSFDLINNKGLGLYVLDGNHRFSMFKRILTDLNENRGIPAIIAYESGKEYKDHLKESGYSFFKVDEKIKQRISDESLKYIKSLIEKGYQIIFCNSLNHDDFGGFANKPGPIINEYMQRLYDEFIKDNKSKSFDTSNLILKSPDSDDSNDDDSNDDEFILEL